MLQYSILRSVEVLTKCMKDPDMSALLRRQQLALQHGLPLGSYLLKPVQRILKYHVMLQVGTGWFSDVDNCCLDER